MDAHNYQALSNKGVTLAMRGNSTGNKNDVAQGIELIEKALKIAPERRRFVLQPGLGL